MKKLLLLALLSIPALCEAQVTITNADMPSMGDTVRLSTTGDQWSINTSQTGGNYTWNFSFLTPQSQKIDTFRSVITTPLAYQYFFNNQTQFPEHKANYAVPGQDFGFQGIFQVTDVYNYYKNTSDEYRNVGFGAKVNGLPMSVRNNPIDTIYKFPLTDPTTYDSYSSYEINVPSTFYYRQRKWVTATTDGYGTLITPLGSFQTVRIKLFIDIEDSVYVDAFSFGYTLNRPQEIQYHWLANGHDVPVLQINEINGNITSIIYKDLPMPGTSVQENNVSVKMNLFPNPANDVTMINASIKMNAVQIYDLEGKLIRNIPLNYPSNSQLIFTGDLSNGIYFVKCIGEEGECMEKLIISK